MTPLPRASHRLLLLQRGLLALSWVAGSAAAQSLPAAASAAAPTLPAFDLQGQALDGQSISLAAYRGKVVMLYYWGTNCAVCRDKLPELRSNAAGWDKKSFQLITINVDKRRADVLAYQTTTQAVLSPDQRLPTLWRGDANYRDTLAAAPVKLPLTLVLDVKGRLVQRYEGRIPAAAWDTVAELLP